MKEILLLWLLFRTFVQHGEETLKIYVSKISKNSFLKLLSSLFGMVLSFPCLISHSYLLNLYILPFGPLLHLKTMHGWEENKLLFEPSLVDCDIQTFPAVGIVKMDRVKRKKYCSLKLAIGDDGEKKLAEEKKCNHCGTNKQTTKRQGYSLLTTEMSKN